MLPVLALLASANAAPTVTVQGTCPGPLTIAVSDLTPLGSFAIIAGDRLGRATAPVGACAGQEILIKPNGDQFGIFEFQADAAGEALLTPTLPRRWCDAVFSVMDLNTCEQSHLRDVSHPECNTTAYITSNTDMAGLDACRSLDGVWVNSSTGLPTDISDLRLPNLIHTGFVTAFTISTMSLPKLKTVETIDMRIDGVFALPSLERADIVFFRGDLTQIWMPKLETIGAQVNIDDFPNLTEIQFPSLRAIGLGSNRPYPRPLASGGDNYLNISDNPILSTLHIGAVEEISSLYIQRNPSLCPTLSDPAWPDFNTVPLAEILYIQDNAPGCAEWVVVP